MDPRDHLLVKAEAINALEVTWWGAALRAIQDGLGDKAHAIVQTGGMAEHYRALLHEDPSQITPEQSAQMLHLLEEFDRALRLVGTPGAPYP